MDKRVLPLVVVIGLTCSAGVEAATWRVPADFATIQEAIDSPAVEPGDTIFVAPGSHAGAIVTKQVEIKGEGGAVITSGPKPWPTAGAPRNTFQAGFLFSGNGAGSGATLSHLRFETVEFPVFSRGADNITVTHNTLINAIQAVTSWAGSGSGSFGMGWTITHNEILDLQTSNGGGIGIIVADYQGGTTATDNLIAHNKISGTLHVGAGDGGDYNGTGIALYADFRGGASGGELSFNRVTKNKIALTSDTPWVVDVVAVELTVTDSLLAACKWVHDNAVNFNDLRGTVWQLDLTDTLDQCNNVTKNLGENRGHGLHPKAFSPE
jgi:hypothetical protein